MKSGLLCGSMTVAALVLGAVAGPVAPAFGASAISISNGRATEGDTSSGSLRLRVTLSEPSASRVSVDYATTDGTAVSPADFAAASGTLKIPAGSTRRVVRVAVAPDALDEGNETFGVTLSNPVNATIADGTAHARIRDNDAAVNETGAASEADYCVTQYPQSLTLAPGATSSAMYGDVTEAGVTDSPGPGAGVLAQVGYGPQQSDPRTQPGWRLFDATYSGDPGAEEYVGEITAPDAPQVYSFAWRFSVDGGATWTYCDVDGAGSAPGSDFSTGALGTLTVSG